MKKFTRFIAPIVVLSCVSLFPMYLAPSASALICTVPYPDGTVGTGTPSLLHLGLDAGEPSDNDLKRGILNGKLYFSGGDGPHGYELWVTDGTSGSTSFIKDIDPGTDSSDLYEFTLFNNKLYFSANDGTNGWEPWVSDGTSGGTSIVKDINPSGGSSGPYEFTAMNNKMYFGADDGTNGNELWVTDGTSGGTGMVKDIYSGVDASNPQRFIVLNNKLYFQAVEGTHGFEPWVSDGTAGGTSLIKDINPGTGNSPRSYFTAFNNKLYFQADDGVNNRELWSTDGTSGGTSMVKDINVGASGGSRPYYFTVLNGTLYFMANDCTHGYELWSTDGTSAGTKLVSDTYPGYTSGSADYITALNNYLVFLADDGVNGFSFRSLTTTPATPPTPPSLIPNRPRPASGAPSINPDSPLVKLSSTADSIICTAESLLLQTSDSTSPASAAIQQLSLLANGLTVATGIAVNGVVKFDKASIRGGVIRGVTYTCLEYATFQGAVLVATSRWREVEQKATQVLRDGRAKALSTYTANLQRHIQEHHDALAAISEARAAARAANQSVAPFNAQWKAEMAKWNQSRIDDRLARDAALEQGSRDSSKILSDAGVGLIG